jgi:nucleotide-binding universal stress UspA family protein
MLFRAVGLPPEVPQRYFASSTNSLVDTLLEEAKRSLVELERSLAPELSDGVYTEVGSPWDGICRAAAKFDADLIVIGSHGYGTLERLLGTTAAKVVNHADRSVLVVRPRPTH